MDAATVVSGLDRQIAREKRGFSVHAAVYGAVVASLWFLWLLTQAEQDIVPWPIFTTLGWGIGLTAHFAGMRRKVRLLEGKRNDALQHGIRGTPELALPPADAETDATLARAEALLQRERQA